EQRAFAEAADLKTIRIGQPGTDTRHCRRTRHTCAEADRRIRDTHLAAVLYEQPAVTAVADEDFLRDVPRRVGTGHRCASIETHIDGKRITVLDHHGTGHRGKDRDQCCARGYRAATPVATGEPVV